jgi:hypothetical protein
MTRLQLVDGGVGGKIKHEPQRDMRTFPPLTSGVRTETGAQS